MMKSVITQCSKCSGYGVRREPEAPKGVGVVCDECKGTGKTRLWYKPFTKRRARQGIKQVTELSSGLGAIGFGSTAGPRISYEEFLNGKMPPCAFTTVP